MSRRVAIIGTVGIPARYGGFETLAEQLVRHLGADFDFTVYCSTSAYSERLARHDKARLRYIPLRANGIQSIPYDVCAMLMAYSSTDTLLLLGVSGAICLPLLRRRFRGRILAHIDGLEWRRAKWGRLAKFSLRGLEALAVRHSDVTIADNEVIEQYVAKSYGVRAELIAYGGDHVNPRTRDDAFLRGVGVGDSAYAFAVCRIEPENGIHGILRGFEALSEWPLIVVGNWKNSDYGRDLLDRYRKVPHFHLLDPIYDPHLLDSIRSNCAMYLHGHTAGGTNPSLVEAMELGLPVLAADVPYNRATTEDQALFFDTPESLVARVRNTPPDARARVGTQLRSVAQRRYRWAGVAERYRQIL